MLGFFPTPYPDELLYSVCARYGALIGYSNARHLMRNLFGTTNATVTPWLPVHLGHLIAMLPNGHGYTVDQLIDQHTLLPFLSPFLPPERVSGLRDAMRGDRGKGLYTASGLNASRIENPMYLRFCPVCVSEEKRRFQECYWHRAHQLPQIDVCHVHGVFLEDSLARVRNPRNKHQFFPAELVIPDIQPRALNRSNRSHQVLLQLATDAAWVLSHPGLKPTPQAVRNRYVWLLAERKVMRYSGRMLRNGQLEAHLRRAFPPFLLRGCGSKYGEQFDFNWVSALVRSPKNSQHPLGHLLLMQFLKHTAEEFFALPEQFDPFGEGPWPCLNRASEHYGEDRIQTCSVRFPRVDSRPVGRFACDCGFHYTRRGPDRVPADRYHRHEHVGAYGAVWESALRTLWGDPDVGLLEIARRLGVTSVTVKQQAARLALSFSRFSRLRVKVSLKRSAGVASTRDDLLQKKRAEWLAAIQAHPEAGMQGIIDRFPYVYQYLRRFDKAWLMAHRLPARTFTPGPRGDWGRRDAALVAQVPSVVVRIQGVPGRPIQLTKASIGREVWGRSLGTHHLEKMPLLRAAVSQVVETSDAFALRRVRWASAQFAAQGIRPQRWELFKLAGLRWGTALSPVLEQAVTEALASPSSAAE